MTDTEVLQEVLHRYVAIDRRDAIESAFDALLGVVDEVLSVDLGAVQRANRLFWDIGNCLLATPCISPLVEQNRIRQILGFDTGFDVFPGIARLS